MIGAVLLLALLSAHSLALGRLWWGDLAPDPMVLVIAGLALQGQRRVLLPGAVVAGWLRALVLLEPAGGQVLGAWAAIFLVASLREHLGARSLLTASVLAAGTWAGVTLLLSAITGSGHVGLSSLFLGAGLAIPFSLVGALRRRRRELSAA